MDLLQCLTTAYDTLASGVILPKNVDKRTAYWQDRKTLYTTLAATVKDILDRDRNAAVVDPSSNNLSLWDDTYYTKLKDEDVDVDVNHASLVDSGTLDSSID